MHPTWLGDLEPFLVPQRAGTRLEEVCGLVVRIMDAA